MTSIQFCKNLVFGFGFTKLTAVSFFSLVFCTVCYLMCMHSTECFPVYCFISCFVCFSFTCRELIPLIVSWSDSQLEVQRYGMKKYFDCWSYHVGNELWMRQCEIPSPSRRSRFLKTELWKLSFQFLNFEVGSVQFLENQCLTFSSGSAHPATSSNILPAFHNIINQSIKTHLYSVLTKLCQVFKFTSSNNRVCSFYKTL